MEVAAQIRGPKAEHSITNPDAKKQSYLGRSLRAAESIPRSAFVNWL